MLAAEDDNSVLFSKLNDDMGKKGAPFLTNRRQGFVRHRNGASGNITMSLITCS